MGLVGASWVHVRPSSYGVHQRSGKCPQVPFTVWTGSSGKMSDPGFTVSETGSPGRCRTLGLWFETGSQGKMSPPWVYGLNQ